MPSLLGSAHWSPKHSHARHWHGRHWYIAPPHPADIIYNSVKHRILKAVQTQLVTLIDDGEQLPLIDRQDVYAEKVATRRNRTTPFVTVSLVGKTQLSGGTTHRADYSHRVKIAFQVEDAQHRDKYLSLVCYWEQLVNRTFVHQRLATVEEVYNCLPDTANVVDAAQFWAQSATITVVYLRFITREHIGRIE